MVRLKIHHRHEWDLTPGEARRLQELLAPLVRETPMARRLKRIAGVDVSVREGFVRAAVAVLAFPDLEPVDEAVWEGPVTFPYVPGLLSFREVPALLQALKRLRTMPDVIVTDGHGFAHPRRFGLACHLGLLLDLPTFGVAKSRLTGNHEEPGMDRGSSVPLIASNGTEVLGAVLRTRRAVSPVYVSIGHAVTLEDAVDLTLRCAPRYRLPETTRAAHRLSLRWAG